MHRLVEAMVLYVSMLITFEPLQTHKPACPFPVYGLRFSLHRAKFDGFARQNGINAGFIVEYCPVNYRIRRS